MIVETLDAIQAHAAVPQLVALLQDAVESGASVGFMPPLGDAEARSYWQGVVTALQGQSRILLVARQDHGIVGTVQLDLARQPNGLHRAEVMKLMVHRSVRRQGVGRALMAAVDEVARENGRSLLLLDTRCGDAAEQLYRVCGYIAFGVVPKYARGSDGELHDTVFFYRAL
jgi:GNAT superfamily N-acetyltransferase